jgi:hypothetical protein
MKAANICRIAMTIVTVTSLASGALATDLGSTNYKIVGATTSTGGGLLDSVSGNYSIMNSLGNISADPREYSTNYKLQQDPSSNFIAAQPAVKCFETTTDGTTNCESGPEELLSGGMAAICGIGGCYNKARFEITPNSNPSDTLYTIAISTDNFANDVKYIDGTTFMPESASNHNINDFRTETYWEDETFNILGLSINTTYYIRISALNGDFTQSDYSIPASTTTGSGSIFFDIDIAPTSGVTTETPAPYTISFTGNDDLMAGAAATTAPSLVWLDISSNSAGGVAVVQFGKYGGLYSATTMQTISSIDANLDSAAEGFGLQSYYIDNDTSAYLGNLAVESNYGGDINTVGAVETTANKIYDGDGPIQNGRVALYLKAKASTSKTPATDYSEEIYFILVPRY